MQVCISAWFTAVLTLAFGPAGRHCVTIPPQLVLSRAAPSQQLPEHCTCVCRKNPYFTNLHPVKQLHYSEDGFPSADATPIEWTEEGVSAAL